MSGLKFGQKLFNLYCDCSDSFYINLKSLLFELVRFADIFRFKITINRKGYLIQNLTLILCMNSKL